MVGHVACVLTYTIFGVNIVLCRDIAIEGGMSPMVIFMMRALVAGLLFWLVSLFLPSEPVKGKELMKVFGAAVLGIFLPQVTFLNAIAYTSPVDLSVITTITPIITMFVAAIFLKEPITWKKVLGVMLSFAGIVWLILQSVSVSHGVAETKPVGLFFLHCQLYSVCNLSWHLPSSHPALFVGHAHEVDVSLFIPSFIAFCFATTA